MKVKMDFHELIDTIQDEKKLSAYYHLIKGLVENPGKAYWKELSQAEQIELIQSWEESFDSTQLLGQDDVKSKLNKWL
jgi:hypothetical protein